MKIALLNMMADAAVKATDQQFARLLPDAELLHFTYPEIERGEKVAAYINENYQTEEQVRAQQPDALVITGANVSDPDLEIQPFWEPLQKTMDWANKSTRSTLCSCLASHAVMQFRYHKKRSPLKRKLWGVYDHRVLMPMHPLAADLPALVPVPQSRHNEVTPGQFQDAKLDVIIIHTHARVHLAASKNNKLVLMQGHPEYDGVSLLKEYKREVSLFVEGVREDYPPMPDNILDDAGGELLRVYGNLVIEAVDYDQAVPEFPESDVAAHLHENWQPAARQVFANWVDMVMKLPVPKNA